MKLSVVIVNYDSSEDLARCLASLRAHPPSCPHAVVVVDNASRDPALAGVRQAHPDVHWILNSENLGYSRGVNRGLAAVAADYALILNPDIVVLPGAIDALLGFADARPKAGIVGPQLLNDDRSIQDSCRRFYTLRTLLLRRTPLGRLFPNSRSVREHLMGDFDHQSERAVDWVLGGCMLVRRKARERTGPLDERFFLYLEDVDWCYRMWQAGWDVLYTPDARFVHRHRRASAKGALHPAFWFHLGSLISFYEKWGLVIYLLKKWRGPLTRALLWVLDMVALNGALLGAYLLRAALNPLFPEALFPLADYRRLFLFASLLTTVTFVLRGRYRRSRIRHAAELSSAGPLVGLVALLLLATTYLSRQQIYSRAVLLLFVPIFGLALSAVGALFAVLRAHMERGHLSLERTLLVGPAPAWSAWLAARGNLRQDGLDLVGYVCEPGPGADEPPPLGDGELPWLGGRAEIRAVVARYRVSQVVFRDWPTGEPEGTGSLPWLRHQHIRVRWLLEDGGLLAAGARPEPFGGASSLVLEPRVGSALARALAHLADRGAGLLLLALSGLPYLTLRAARGPAIVSLYVWRAAEPAEGPRMRLVVGAGGRPRRLWWQAPLGWDLLRGCAAVFSSESGPAGSMEIWADLVFSPDRFAPGAQVSGSSPESPADPERDGPS